MARSFPPDVVVLDTDSVMHARFGRGRKGPRIMQAKSYRLAAGTFTPAMVTPQLANEGALAEALRRLRNETGKWESLSLLLPDSWFRMNIMDLPSLPKNGNGEALEMVRWSLKRTLPIPPEELRVSYSVLTRDGQAAKVLALSAMNQTLTAIERVFRAAGFDVILIEPVGLNIWNAIAVGEGDTTADRLFVYVRDEDFTTAVFRGSQPLFLRSRNLSGERTLDQELRLSASYLRDSFNADGFANCYVAGDGVDASVGATLASEFNTQVRTISVRDFVDEVPADIQGLDAKLTACTGVFTG
jgi:Tfp pilus assembly PilM family ATPase